MKNLKDDLCDNLIDQIRLQARKYFNDKVWMHVYNKIRWEVGGQVYWQCGRNMKNSFDGR